MTKRYEEEDQREIKKNTMVTAVPDWRVSDGNLRTSPSGIIVATTPVPIAAC